MQIENIPLPELLERCELVFVVKRNRKFDRFRFFSRKQEPNVNLQQIWNALNSLAASSEFEEQTSSLVYDIFILNKHNKAI